MLEKFTIWLVWWLPRYLVYWCAVRLITEATTKPEFANTTMSEITVMDAIKSW